MKFLLVLAVLVAASFATPNFPTTFQAHYKFQVTGSYHKMTAKYRNVTTYKGTGIMANDSAKKMYTQCTLYAGQNTAGCKLTDYQQRTTYKFRRDSLGDIGRCVTKATSANASSHTNALDWISKSKNIGRTEFPYCGISADTWEVSFKRKSNIKIGVSEEEFTRPVAMIVKNVKDKGYVEKHFCVDEFTTTVDPDLLVIPPACRQMTDYPEEDLFDMDDFF